MNTLSLIEMKFNFNEFLKILVNGRCIAGNISNKKNHALLVFIRKI